MNMTGLDRKLSRLVIGASCAAEIDAIDGKSKTERRNRQRRGLGIIDLQDRSRID
jgi:hypothetical protein